MKIASNDGNILSRMARFSVSDMALCAAMVCTSVAMSPIVRAADALERSLTAVDAKVVAWRRDLHANPELSNREFRTSKLVAEHLRKLGLKVETGIARTGVVALLEGGKPGPTVALRADMDGLPVVEQADVPFKSLVTSTYRGETVGVMHACGHDAHTSVLMGVAEAFTSMRADITGRILFVFQPAEEGPPDGEEGGAPLMLREGVFDKIQPEVAFALHVTSTLRVGTIGYRAGPLMAGSDSWRIVVKGRQTHGARPWGGVDPIVVSAQIVNALQTVVSRQVDITENPAVVTVGAIKGGIRNNIVPDSVEMIGTIRTFDKAQRQDIFDRITRMVENTAAASGASATFTVDAGGNPVVFNNPELTATVLDSLRKTAPDVRAIPLVTGAEDFAFFAQRVPSFFYFVGITPADQNPVLAPSNHSPLFYVDERGLPIAARSLARVTLDYMTARAAAGAGK
jgi:amidohydrolase